MKLFKRKLTTDYIRKHYKEFNKGWSEVHIIGPLSDSNDDLLLEIREDNKFCLEVMVFHLIGFVILNMFIN